MQCFLLAVYGEVLEATEYLFWQSDFDVPISRRHWRIPAGVSCGRLFKSQEGSVELVLVERKIWLEANAVQLLANAITNTYEY